MHLLEPSGDEDVAMPDVDLPSGKRLAGLRSSG
jgi:hypothetical protein